MKRSIIVLLIFAWTGSVYAQNIVENPDFESVNPGNLLCSWYISQGEYNSAINGWTMPTGGSTDIFTMTNDQSCYCHPLSTHPSSPGPQTPHSGDVFCNITVYGDGGCDPYREYLEGHLTETMVPGTQYQVEFYVSFAENCTYATNNIGVYFTTSQVSVTSMCVYDVTPHLNETSIITEYEDWVLLSFTFTPTEAYEYFIIGNFYYDSETNTTYMGGSKETIRYYVDDVSIEAQDVTPTSEFTVTSPVCEGEASEVTYTGTGTASASYDWDWDGGTADPGTGQGPHEVTWQNAGTYDVSLTVTENGNTSETTTHSVTVNPNPDASFTATSQVCLSSNATVTFTGSATAGADYDWDFDGGTVVSGSGAGPYQITWGTAGDYTISLTVDDNACTDTQTQDITVFEEPGSEFSFETPICENESATIVYSDTEITGAVYDWDFDGGTVESGSGAGPYEISWDTPGQHSVSLIVDANGCVSGSTSHIVSVNPIPSPDFTIIPMQCFGNNALITYTGDASASADYEWNWNGGTVATGANQGPFEVNWPDAQEYTVHLTVSENGCSASSSESFTQPEAISLDADIEDVSCNGGSDGSITITAEGGTPPYSYNWSEDDMTGADVNGLEADDYTLTLTDDNGCMTDLDVEVSEPTPVLISYTYDQSLCYGDSLLLHASASGGIPPYTYYWDTGDGFEAAPDEIEVAPEVSQVFSVYVEDANACTSPTGEIEIVVSQPIELTVDLQNNTCYNSCDGSIVVSEISGGIAPYITSWATPNNSQYNLCTGEYLFTVTDASGCSFDTIFTITEPDSLMVSTTTEDATCHNTADGYAWVHAEGGTPPYSYEWSNGTETDTIITYTGHYTVTVTDSLGCETLAQAYIDAPSALYITGLYEQTICKGGQATITASVTGGTGPYYYHWEGSNGYEAAHNSITVSPDFTTQYQFTVTDQNACSATASTIVNVNPGLDILELYFESDSVCIGESVTLHTDVNGGNGGPYIVYLNGNNIIDTNYTYYPTQSQWAYVMVEDLCETPPVEDSVYLTVLPLPSCNFVSDRISGCPPLEIVFNEISADETNSYFWEFGDEGIAWGKTMSHTYTNSGFYDVTCTVTDEYGCEKTRTLADMIHAYPIPSLEFTADPTNPSILNPQVEFTALTQQADSLYWHYGDGDSSHFSQTNPVHTYTGIGDFEVVLIGDNHYGCVDTIRKTIHVQDYFAFYAPDGFTPNFDGRNDCFSVCGTGIDPNEFELVIYDRWGMPVFETTYYPSQEDCSSCHKGAWDGTNHGSAVHEDDLLPAGAYAWICRLKDISGVERVFSGVVHVIR